MNIGLYLLEWLVAILTVVICVWIHANVIVRLESHRVSVNYNQGRIIFVMSCLIATHIFEIIIFAVGYYLILIEPGFGSIQGIDTSSLVDYIYFSSVVYTTLGFGDLVPEGMIRIYTSVESLTGLSLVAWSTSAAFIEIQKMSGNKK